MRLTELININALSGGQRNRIFENRRKYNAMEDVSDVFKGYAHYKELLFEKIIDMFVYDGLPETVPADALENYILRFGLAGVVYSQYGLVTVPANKYGVGLYDHYEPYFKYATPLVSGNATIGLDGVIIKNNAFEMSMNEFVNRYARMLADIESSISICTSNIRRDTIATSRDEASAESYKAVELANRLGQTDVVIDSNFIETIKYMPISKTAGGQEVNNLITARENILKAFLQEVGVEMANDKRERLTVSEVNSNSQLLVFNISDMLTARKNGVEAINRVFGTNIKVTLNPAYNIIGENKEEKPVEKMDEKKGGADNEQVEN